MSSTEHSPALHKAQEARRVTLLAIWVDAIVGLVKLITGIIVGSAALVADGIHSFSDLVTDGFVLAATHYGSQDPDHDHPYGHGRIETLATLFLGSVLIFVAGAIAWSSIERLVAGAEIPPPGLWAMLIALLALLAKEALFRLTMRVARRLRSKLLEANAWHSRSDVLSTGVVLVGLVGTQLGHGWLDTIAAVIVGLLVGKVGWDLLWESGRELVDTALPVPQQEAMREVALSVPGVAGVHDLRTRQSAGHTMLDLHVVVPPRISVSEGHEIGNEVSRRLRQAFPALTDLTFHIDPEDDAGEGDPSRLPGLPLRPAVEAALTERWAGLPEWPWILDLELHYLEGAVTVVACLDEHSPLESAATARRLARAADDLEWFAQVEIRRLAALPSPTR
ncbi:MULTISPECIES: cation diffusion facilitator family transporter [unclassified Halomonas]|uniref:cation diffusion facilitator family transporter n=1 Tax=unclassified Halomonas TaxID=2609666 RepID=UPI000D70F1E3|nr:MULTISPECIES: cation diffusion facilitator family transporter [unclassified Halomonas]AXY43430.1 cation transporter [Halomonas sp. JS92-SW72]PWV72026.1 cation diffusion facilitator family transporter [Halomonas sp. A11-A]QJQ98034.1 cation transporter [Halomonas sp. PGE1]